jgi:hypothetical protein
MIRLGRSSEGEGGGGGGEEQEEVSSCKDWYRIEGTMWIEGQWKMKDEETNKLEI